MPTRRITIILISILYCIRISAERPNLLYNVDFLTYFDNREYHSEYQIPQTIFSFRLSPEIGIGINDRSGGSHRVMAGIHYTQPLGAYWDKSNFSPIAYYRYDYKGIRISLGSIPYIQRIERLPDYLLYDSIAYATPNIRGALLSYSSNIGYVEFMCDWRGFRSDKTREMFRLVVNGLYHHHWLELGGFAQINHKAGFAPPTQHEGVCDDIYIQPQIGINLSKYTPLDSLCLRGSYIIGIQRYRDIQSTKIPQGGLIEFFARWRFVGLENTLYFGQDLMPFYSYYGSDLNQGDPFYRSPLYNRTDLFLYLINNNFVNCYFSWNIHYDAQRIQHQQQLIIRFSLDGLHKKEKLKGLFDK